MTGPLTDIHGYIAGGLNPAHGDCRCPCHTTPGMVHVVACCAAATPETEALIERLNAFIAKRGILYAPVPTEPDIQNLEVLALRPVADALTTAEAQVASLTAERDSLSAENKRLTGERDELDAALDILAAQSNGWQDYATTAESRIAQLTKMLEGAVSRWDRLMSCQRIRVVGMTSDMNHIGMEFWREHPERHPSSRYPQEKARELFTEFVDALTPPPETTPTKPQETK